MHKIDHILRERNLVTAQPHEAVYDVAQRMTGVGVGALVVVEDEHLVGIFSERDLMTRVIVRGFDPHDVAVGDVMTREVVTAALGDRRSDCLETMKAAGCRHLPVLADGRVIGMLSMRDLLFDEIEEQGDEIRNLRAYIHQVPLL